MTNINKLIRYLSVETITNNLDAYQFIINLINDEKDLSNLINEFMKREQNGDIQIEEGVVLPHLETDLIKNSQILIINSRDKIEKWNKNINNVDLIICLLLKKEEKIEIKREISQFMTKLADIDYIEQLRRRIEE